MLTTYIVKSKKIKGSLIYKYDNKGILRIYENNAELTKQQTEWFAYRLPIAENLIDNLIKASEGKLQVEKVPSGLSFISFWDAFEGEKK